MPHTLVVRAEMAELARAATDVVTWASDAIAPLGVPQATSFAIQLCLEEAVSNILLHGDAGQTTELRLALEPAGDALILTIEDDGAAFDPLAVAAPAPRATAGEITIGGVGIHLMRQFAQHLAYERRDGTNRLILRFEPASAADRGQARH